jgi:hypothetical protein
MCVQMLVSFALEMEVVVSSEKHLVYHFKIQCGMYIFFRQYVLYSISQP